jgi:hypothetical protein
MNRTLIQRNLRSAIIIGGIAAGAFAAAFGFTAIWVG